mgnify:CR=1 FL=1
MLGILFLDATPAKARQFKVVFFLFFFFLLSTITWNYWKKIEWTKWLQFNPLLAFNGTWTSTLIGVWFVGKAQIFQ